MKVKAGVAGMLVAAAMVIPLVGGAAPASAEFGAVTVGDRASDCKATKAIADTYTQNGKPIPKAVKQELDRCKAEGHLP